MLLLSPTNSKQISPCVNLENKEIQGDFDVTISELCSCSSVQYKDFLVFQKWRSHAIRIWKCRYYKLYSDLYFYENKRICLHTGYNDAFCLR